MPGHSFLPGKDAADKLVRKGALMVLSAISCSLSPPIFRIYSLFFLDWKRTVSSKFFDPHVPSLSTEELVLQRHARCFVFTATNTAYCLSFYLSRIGRIESLSCSACAHPSQDISHLILHYPTMDSSRRPLFGASLSLYYLWSRRWEVVLLLGLRGLPPRSHSLEGVE